MTHFAFSSFGRGRIATCSHLTTADLRSAGMCAVDVIDTGSSWMLKASHHDYCNIHSNICKQDCCRDRLGTCTSMQDQCLSTNHSSQRQCSKHLFTDFEDILQPDTGVGQLQGDARSSSVLSVCTAASNGQAGQDGYWHDSAHPATDRHCLHTEKPTLKFLGPYLESTSVLNPYMWVQVVHSWLPRRMVTCFGYASFQHASKMSTSRPQAPRSTKSPTGKSLHLFAMQAIGLYRIGKIHVSCTQCTPSHGCS